jgi:hypothetical protein
MHYENVFNGSNRLNLTLKVKLLPPLNVKGGMGSCKSCEFKIQMSLLWRIPTSEAATVAERVDSESNLSQIAQSHYGLINL